MGDGEHGVVLGGGDALKGAHVGELGVGDDDADGLGAVHGGAAADGDDGIGLGSLEGLNAVGNVLDGGVGLDVGVDAVGDAGLIQQVGDLGGDAELHQIGVGADKDLLVAAALQLAGDLLDGAGAMIGDGVENDAISHDVASVHRYIGSTAPFGAAVWCSRLGALPFGFAAAWRSCGLATTGRAVVPPTFCILYLCGTLN